MDLSTVGAMKNLNSRELVSCEGEKLRQLQLIILSIFDDIKAFCDEHGLEYTLGGGSVLGAIRHHGFIPWDDDMDMDMPRADYDIFMKRFPEKYKDKYWVEGPELTPEVGIMASRVRLKGTACRMHEDMGKGLEGKDCGIFIDIFAVENTYDSALRRKLHGLRCMANGLFCSCRRYYRDKDFYLKLVAGNAQLERTIKTKAAIGWLLSYRSMEGWVRHTLRRYRACSDTTTKYVTVPAGREHFFKGTYQRCDFVETREVEFEGRKVKVPRDAEGYLTRLYGPDCMTPPAPNKREHHAYFDLDFGNAVCAQVPPAQQANKVPENKVDDKVPESTAPENEV